MDRPSSMVRSVTLISLAALWMGCGGEDSTAAPDVCVNGTQQTQVCGASDEGLQRQDCLSGAWVDSACLSFNDLGEGECRQADGDYPIRFLAYYYDLDPFTDGTNGDDAHARCEAKCREHDDWCLAVQVVLDVSWPVPRCALVTDAATFQGAGWTFENPEWGGAQEIDGASYQTYCGGIGGLDVCLATAWGGGALNPRAAYNCKVLVKD